MRTGQNIYKRRDDRWEARIPLGIKPMAVATSNAFMEKPIWKPRRI